MGRYTIISISKGDMRGASALIDLAAIAILLAQCTAETAYMTVDTASM